ncbi:dnaJ-like protein subfamily C member 8-like protein [Dinothrombium tinctorium]|uniref:DnaJ-like protein subfamily C member 8-like protein n=1 Tax=Dinothrombium tinctorium TaxID=1965070 RepID=A0A3S3SLS1_9ACAR|nr:dnaJ-like protein subfamily C member 8-like protein [Dinothrombium tinctorium]RWS17589.1 dnaJ-like protein subfamily C member 8-like protein [Dinothrombium tinctorium]RWS17599.1 dnaJ-like protein subfamily C member 8-like protein [Dinothrombium tinctorium]
MKEVKRIEAEDSIYTSEKQIHRLLKTGSTYRNLNPFEVLLVDPDSSLEEIRKQYKKLSILLHPDKNPNDRERAQSAFDILNKAYKTLEDETSRSKALEVVEEAKFRVNQTIEEKKKKLRKEGKKDTRVEEDNPEHYKHSVKVMTMKLFADYERKRRLAEERATEERKRKREEEIENEEKKKIEQEWNKNYEESRECRVSSWKSFVNHSKAKRKEFRPPKHKSESR